MHVVWFMPNRESNVLLGTHSRSQVVTMGSVAVAFGVLEAAPIVIVCRTIKKRYGLQSSRLLGFVLERYWMSFHGKLVGVFVITFFCLSETHGVVRGAGYLVCVSRSHIARCLQPSVFQPGKV